MAIKKYRITIEGDTVRRGLDVLPASEQSAIRSSGYSLSGSSALSLLDLAGTWNTAGNPTGIKLNVTNTSSGASSLLFDLQASSVSKFSVTKTGFTTIAMVSLGATSADGLQLINSTAAAAGAQQFAPAIHLTGQGWKTDAVAASQPVDWKIINVPVQGTANPTSNLLTQISINGGAYSTRLTLSSGGIVTAFGSFIALSAGIRIASTGGFEIDTRLFLNSSADGIARITDIAGTSFGRLQFGGTTSSFPAIGRNGASLDIFGADAAGASGVLIYNTRTSATNFERLDLNWAANVAKIWTEKGSGGGTARALVLGADATELMRFGSATTLSFFGVAAVARQTSGANLTNNVTAGGTNGTIANYTDLVVYATDAAAIRNNIYQLARSLKTAHDALRLYGLLT